MFKLVLFVLTTTLSTGAFALTVEPEDGLVGWATLNPGGMPTGGASPNGMDCTASSVDELKTCISVMHDVANRNKPFTLYIRGELDGRLNADGSGYTVIEIKRSNVSVLGLAKKHHPPTLKGFWVVVKAEQNVVIRNVRFIPGRDHELKVVDSNCSSSDPDFCDWQAEPDGLTIQGTQGVWIDHCEFSDGPTYYGINPHKGHYKGYDGLLEIIYGANYVTVSYSKFSNHDKSILIGHADERDTDDFHVTFYRNHFHYLGQRSPLVRFGKVHLVNNLYENRKRKYFRDKYHMTYAIGLGYKSEVYSEHNVFDIVNASPQDLVSVSELSKWAQHFTDVGSWMNGHTVSLNTAAKEVIDVRETEKQAGLPFKGKANWKPADFYAYTVLKSPDEVRQTVRNNVGIKLFDF